MSSWHRPLTRIYNDNHAFGTSLYSEVLDDLEKKYRTPIRDTSFRSDRPDLQSPTLYETSPIGSAVTLRERPNHVERRAERPKSMYDEASTSSVFEKELRQMNSKSTWDLKESRLQVDKSKAKQMSKRTAPRNIYTNCKFMDSIFVGPHGYRIFY